MARSSTPSYTLNSDAPSSLVVIDAAVREAQMLFSGVLPDAEICILEGTCDGVEQITKQLATRCNIQNLHIVAHGSPETIQLGSTHLTLFNLDRYGWQLQQWGESFTIAANILLHGGSADTTLVSPFLSRLSLLTGANIASVHDLVNHAPLLQQTAALRRLPFVSGQ